MKPGLPVRVRQFSNAKIKNDSIYAWMAYENFRNLPEVFFLSEPNDIDNQLNAFIQLPEFRSDSWTDAYLAALAVATGARLVSFDSDFQTYQELNLLLLK